MNTCAQMLQSQPICACGRMMQNCQTLVPAPMLAPFVCAEGWICFFGNLFASLLCVLKAFVLPSVLLCSFHAIGSRTVRSSRDICQAQDMTVVRFLGFMNCP